MKRMDIKLISSLEKCFIEDSLEKFTEYKQATVFKNEIFTFQVALKSEKLTEKYAKNDVFPVIESDIKDYITLKEVSYIPCEIPAIKTCDEGVDRVKAGIFPDWLKEFHYLGMFRLPSEQLRTFMVTVDPALKLSGTFDIKIKIVEGVYDKGLKATDKLICEDTFTLTVKDTLLPETRDNIYPKISTNAFARTELFEGVDEMARPYARTRLMGAYLFKFGFCENLDSIKINLKSRHYNAFLEMKNDISAYNLCSKLYSFEETVKAMEEVLGEITVDKCLYKVDEMMALRNKINEMICLKL